MATLRARVSITSMAFSGLRPQTPSNYTETDGIRLRDFVETEVNEKGIAFAKIPTLMVRRGLSKAKHQYFTFVSQQTITYIEEYLVRGLSEAKDSTKALYC